MGAEECQSEEVPPGAVIGMDAEFIEYRLEMNLKEEAYRREIENLKRQLS